MLRQAFLTAALITSCISSAGGEDAVPSRLRTQFSGSVQPFLEIYCVSCHNHEKHKGDLDLVNFNSVESVLGDFRKWDLVLEKIRSDEMPPEEAKKQPTAPERQTLTTWGAATRKYAVQRNAGDPGTVLARRLNNAEYDYSIRDLTGVDIRPTREFPVDPANEAGFDNSGESLAMSPALVKKYLEAAHKVSEHLVLQPHGFTFAPDPTVTDTDRDKFGVNRIVDFYHRQPTDLADYFHSAWTFSHREALGLRRLTLAEVAARGGVSPKYLATVYAALTGPAERLGPLAAAQAMWRELPVPVAKTEPNDLRKACVRIRDFVVKVRIQVKPVFANLTARGLNEGTQSLVLWKDRQWATHRFSYGGGAFKLKLGDLPIGTTAIKAMTPPQDETGRQQFEASFTNFCAVFPDAFYIAARARTFVDSDDESELAAARLLSAGFHNQMGYFRDDAPLYDQVLSPAGQAELDDLWREFNFSAQVPLRQHRNFLWYERAESGFMLSSEFDFTRAEDKDSTAEATLKRLAEVYLAKVRRNTTNPLVLEVVRDHFERVNANIRAVEKDLAAAEPSHLKALQDFAERAYRRPLQAREREEIVAFYHHLRDQDGLTHEDAIRDSVASVLMSPFFCYRVSPPTESSGVHALSDYALASRLSYFLWSSLPDHELLAHAAAGDLHRSKVLLAQTHRMLNDDRIRALATEFGGNWLGFRRFEEHNAVDRGRFPQFDNTLREAMYQEPIRFLEELVRSNRSVLDCLYADYTFVNPPLAKHYGIPTPTGGTNDWVRVENAGQYGRGGLLPMSAFLTMNAPGLRTSPVKRGYWVVRRLLGEVIPAPPPNVPTLPADEANLGNLTLRETLARHREDKNCAGCHARFDAVGLVFEGFGPIGERRTQDFAGHPVDTRATFPGGSEGSGMVGLRTYVHDHREDDFLDNFCRKLLAYGLGRSLQLSDELTIQAMRSKLAASHYRFDTLIDLIVNSPQFLNQRTTGELAKY